MMRKGILLILALVLALAAALSACAEAMHSEVMSMTRQSMVESSLFMVIPPLRFFVLLVQHNADSIIPCACSVKKCKKQSSIKCQLININVLNLLEEL